MAPVSVTEPEVLQVNVPDKFVVPDTESAPDPLKSMVPPELMVNVPIETVPLMVTVDGELTVTGVKLNVPVPETIWLLVVKLLAPVPEFKVNVPSFAMPPRNSNIALLLFVNEPVPLMVIKPSKRFVPPLAKTFIVPSIDVVPKLVKFAVFEKVRVTPAGTDKLEMTTGPSWLRDCVAENVHIPVPVKFTDPVPVTVIPP